MVLSVYRNPEIKRPPITPSQVSYWIIGAMISHLQVQPSPRQMKHPSGHDGARVPKGCLQIQRTPPKTNMSSNFTGPFQKEAFFGRGIRGFGLYVANICWRDGQKKEKGSINAESFPRCGGMMHFQGCTNFPGTCYRSFRGSNNFPKRHTDSPSWQGYKWIQIRTTRINGVLSHQHFEILQIKEPWKRNLQ